MKYKLVAAAAALVALAAPAYASGTIAQSTPVTDSHLCTS